MSKGIMLGGVLVLGLGAGVAMSQAFQGGAGSFEVWGHTFDYGNLEPKEAYVAIATDRKTHKKMMVIKLKGSDRMMALMSPEAAGMSMMVGDFVLDTNANGQ